MKNKKNELIATLILLSMGLLAACKEETKSKEWFKEHPKETVEVYKKCQQSGEDSDNCKNAKWSHELLEAKRMAGLSTGL